MITELIDKIDTGDELSPSEMGQLLEVTDDEQMQLLFDCAYRIKEKYVGNVAYFRGIIECSNICVKDCFYCGIRKSNKNVERFVMSEDEMIKEALWAYENEYGSVVIQSGERQDIEYIEKIERVLYAIKEKTNNELGITLSLGEQTEDVYKRWFDAGAHRYLLRIETTNPTLFKQIHPNDELHDFETRKNCLKLLRKVGYQVGTGVMMGLPNQTTEDMVNDILFLKEIDVDMVGMGPYIPHKDTPMGKVVAAYDNEQKRKALELALRMISLVRITLKDVNIAASTALQALKHTGREAGLKAGANIIMPNVTETEYRPNYQLYDNKPCTDENSSLCRGCLSKRIGGIGETIGFNQWGDSPHFRNRRK